MERVFSPAQGIGDLPAKWTYVARTMPDITAVSIGPQTRPPCAGDLVVARVSAIGAHDHVEDRFGRQVRVYDGDLIVGAYGNRYATDFFEGYIPTGAQTHLLTAGGLIGTVASAHEAHPDPTDLEVVGALLAEDGHPLSLEDFARPYPPPAVPSVGTIAVVGSSMNAGKTTTAAHLIRGWTKAGFAVGAGKVTGSGSGKDRWAYRDAGAVAVVDFLDFGMPSTFGYPLERLGATMRAIRDALCRERAEVVILEIADGLLQAETCWLLDHLAGVADALVLAVVDALSARSGVEILRDRGLAVRAVGGLVTRSPLASREAAAATGLPILSPGELSAGAAVRLLTREGVPA